MKVRSIVLHRHITYLQPIYIYIYALVEVACRLNKAIPLFYSNRNTGNKQQQPQPQQQRRHQHQSQWRRHCRQKQEPQHFQRTHHRRQCIQKNVRNTLCNKQIVERTYDIIRHLQAATNNPQPTIYNHHPPSTTCNYQPAACLQHRIYNLQLPPTHKMGLPWTTMERIETKTTRTNSRPVDQDKPKRSAAVAVQRRLLQKDEVYF